MAFSIEIYHACILNGKMNFYSQPEILKNNMNALGTGKTKKFAFNEKSFKYFTRKFEKNFKNFQKLVNSLFFSKFYVRNEKLIKFTRTTSVAEAFSA